MTLLQVPAPPPPSSYPDPNLIAPLVQEAVLIIVGLIALVIIAVKVLGPVARALAGRIEGKFGNSELRTERELLREQVVELDQVRGRVLELEERVEFTERLLAEGRGRDQLPREGDSSRGIAR